MIHNTDNNDQPEFPFMQDIVPTEPETSEVEVTALKLGDEFDSALLGATIRGQFAYSLTQLTILAMNQRTIAAEEAQEFVAQQVLAVTKVHGDAAPVFIDDWLLAEKTLQEQMKQEIAIPGQNHGAVKGFLNPNGLR
jgi:hypothetical protein